MELILDDTFKDLYDLYYGDLRHQRVLELVNETFNKYDYDLINEVVNIVKTSITLGFTFTRCYDKIVSKIVERFPIQDDIDIFILNIVLKVLVASGVKGVEKLLLPRDIFKEVAARYFRVPQKRVTDEMVSRIKDASETFSGRPKIMDDAFSGWDAYFYGVAFQVARNSRCFIEKEGAILVRDRIVIGTGYNGPPRGLPRCDSRWILDQDFNTKFKDLISVDDVKGICPFIATNKRVDSKEICIGCHAEANVLVSAAMEGISTKGASLYTTGCIPCGNCLALIINSGIKEIIVSSLEVKDTNSMYLLNQSKLEIRLFDFVK